MRRRRGICCLTSAVPSSPHHTSNIHCYHYQTMILLPISNQMLMCLLIFRSHPISCFFLLCVCVFSLLYFCLCLSQYPHIHRKGDFGRHEDQTLECATKINPSLVESPHSHAKHGTFFSTETLTFFVVLIYVDTVIQ